MANGYNTDIMKVDTFHSMHKNRGHGEQRIGYRDEIRRTLPSLALTTRAATRIVRPINRKGESKGRMQNMKKFQIKIRRAWLLGKGRTQVPPRALHAPATWLSC